MRLLLLLLVCCTAIPLRAQQDRPNILFLFSDDQRADALGAAENPYIHTPNLDRLAAEGTRFTQNYCMGSHHGAVCAPSRAMLMSGRSLHRVYDKLNGITTLPMVLRQNGYRTFGTGKWHNEREAFAAGFTNGKDVFLGGMSDHYHVPVRDLLPDGSFSPVQRKDYSSTLFADAAIAFLDQYVESKSVQPFFSYVAFTAPHDPRSPLPQYQAMYDPAGIPLPPDAMEQHPFDIGPMKIRDEVLGAWPRTQSQIRSQIADYYGMITHMDHEIGRILESLENNGLADNTLIIFSSDHGLGLGSHGMLGKQNLYEPGMHAPLIFHGPGIPKGETRDALVYLLDIFPTLCDVLDLEVPEGVEGQSLTGIIQGEQKGVRQSLFTTYTNTQRALRDHRWKLIVYPQINHRQLFDLKNDPHELRNLAEDSLYLEKLSELTVLMKRWQKQLGDTLALERKDPQAMAFDPTGFRRIPDRHQPIYNLWHYFAEPAGAGKLLIYQDELLDIFPLGTEVELLGEDFGFTEGPVWHPQGYLLFSDIPRNTIHRWTEKDGFSVYRHPSANSNGLAVDAEGNLLAVHHGSRNLTRIDKAGNQEVLADRFEGKRLNSPNDLAVHSKGWLYFTDPPWGLGDGPDKWDYHPDKELSFNGVFLLKAGELLLIDSTLNRPNGIALSPDERYLYVGNNQFRARTRSLNIDRTEKSWIRYTLNRNGEVKKREVFLKPPVPYLVGNPDGMKVSKGGNIYCTGPGGLLVFSPDATYLGTLMLPQIPTNCTFGADGYLYITAREAVYRVKPSKP